MNQDLVIMPEDETYFCPFSIFGTTGEWLVECYYDGSNHFSVQRGSCLKAVLDEMVEDVKEIAACDGFTRCEFTLWPVKDGDGPLSAYDDLKAG